jgi:hypothetical protein
MTHEGKMTEVLALILSGSGLQAISDTWLCDYENGVERVVFQLFTQMLHMDAQIIIVFRRVVPQIEQEQIGPRHGEFLQAFVRGFGLGDVQTLRNQGRTQDFADFKFVLDDQDACLYGADGIAIHDGRIKGRLIAAR